MLVFKKRAELTEYLQSKKSEGCIVGFVPTMGALHQGHLSLIEQAVEQSEVVVASIFVNPTQFNNPNDLKNYPRTEEQDLQMLESKGCNVVFMPSVNEIYPEEDKRTFEFDGLDNVMEGAHRPGHFNGVAQVVSRLFELVNPDKAFFGLKDFQQVAIVRKMTQKLGLSINIIPCDTMREEDGLAMSSRNMLLTAEHRKEAPIIYKTLATLKENFRTQNIESVKEFVKSEIEKSGKLELEYFEIADQDTLLSVNEFSKGDKLVGCIAVWAGEVRLIDNIILNL